VKKSSKVIFLVYQEDSTDSGEGWFNQYETLDDAVRSEPQPVEVIEATLKPLGPFISVATVKKAKRGKK
jgi:hypothetical protein